MSDARKHRSNQWNRGQSEALTALIREVRALFHRLKAAAGEAYGEHALTAGMRGVLTDIAQHGPQTVPQMARRRPVTRQHIQTIVNQLLDLGYVAMRANPAHKRSKLVELTRTGRTVTEDIRERELRILGRLPVSQTPAQIQEAVHIMADIRRFFEDPEWLKKYGL
jgi:DNA-binding MarR family transcriptional regulator